MTSHERNALGGNRVEARRYSLRLDGISKVFEGNRVLHDIWLKVEKGEFLTLLGPSGCGKSTILNMVAGFLDCDAGEIFIDGEVVTRVPTYRREIGIVFQNYALFPHMNIRKNVGYGLRMRGVPKADIEERVTNVLELVKLADFGDRRPRQLSGGQQQRVALARALVVEPKVLLLDEPFSALDRNLRTAMQVELKEIQRKTGVTTIFVTHDQEEALSMSDRIVVMSEGRVRQVAKPNQIYDTPADRFVATFVGDASIFWARVADRVGAEYLLDIGGYSSNLPVGEALLEIGAPVEVFVRPESLLLVEPQEENVIPMIVRNMVYQGGHVDIYLECPLATGNHVLVRAATHPNNGLAVGDHIGARILITGTAVFPAAL
jgi:spermidine/putrescine ABC transporter ATP-binding subunit